MLDPITVFVTAAIVTTAMRKHKEQKVRNARSKKYNCRPVQVYLPDKYIESLPEDQKNHFMLAAQAGRYIEAS
jgi:Pyruvate/2-oxoacid:ferredoxin oxidoreductase delta subunit